MCGIAGIVVFDRGNNSRVGIAELVAIREAMARRGPDAAGLWLSPDGRVGLAHRRLAIIDPRPEADQPMSHDEGRYRIVFNGEILNYRELRAELAGQGVACRTTSDTEVLLVLYARFGAEMVTRLRGMFAFAIWDEPRRRLFAARDHFGIRPFYYAEAGGVLHFASQVKALKAGGGLDLTPDPAGRVGFFLFGYVPEPFTLYREIRALPAGHTLTVEEGGVLAAMDQPSIDGINGYLVSKAAAESGLKVALSGLGGDELFGSYPSFDQIPALVRRLAPLRGVPWVGRTFRRVSAPVFRRLTSPKYAGLIEYSGDFGDAYLLRRGLYMPWELPAVLDGEMVREGWRALDVGTRLRRSTGGIPRPRAKVSALRLTWYT